jgi:hypothetical protein
MSLPDVSDREIQKALAGIPATYSKESTTDYILQGLVSHWSTIKCILASLRYCNDWLVGDLYKVNAKSKDLSNRNKIEELYLGKTALVLLPKPYDPTGVPQGPVVLTLRELRNGWRNRDRCEQLAADIASIGDKANASYKPGATSAFLQLCVWGTILWVDKPYGHYTGVQESEPEPEDDDDADGGDDNEDDQEEETKDSDTESEEEVAIVEVRKTKKEKKPRTKAAEKKPVSVFNLPAEEAKKDKKRKSDTDSDTKRRRADFQSKDALRAEIKELKNQLGGKDTQIAKLKTALSSCAQKASDLAREISEAAESKEAMADAGKHVKLGHKSKAKRS